MVAAADTSIPVVPVAEVERLRRREQSPWSGLWDLLDVVCDPEIPALSLWDLGVLQDIQMHDGSVLVTITPTYSGCPAMGAMAEDIETALTSAGHEQVTIETRLSPAWTTDWLSGKARQQLKTYGIAPPLDSIRCPRCDSPNIKLTSEFGSTACKALYQCIDCSEPFDYFKPI